MEGQELDLPWLEPLLLAKFHVPLNIYTQQNPRRNESKHTQQNEVTQISFYEMKYNSPDSI